jgi:purine-binding chemotaxis protein CheW
VRAGRQLCAVPLAHVLEVMRALPVQPVPGAPPYVRGISVVRGAPCPVVDLGALFGASERVEPARFVSLKLKDRGLCLAVDEIVRVTPLRGVGALPPVLAEVRPELRSSLTTLDGELLTVLEASSLVAEAAWQ